MEEPGSGNTFVSHAAGVMGRTVFPAHTGREISKAKQIPTIRQRKCGQSSALSSPSLGIIQLLVFTRSRLTFLENLIKVASYPVSVRFKTGELFLTHVAQAS
jgi:hypothetical protein